MPTIIDDLFDGKRPEERIFEICLDFELAERLYDAKDAYERAQRQSDARPSDSEAAARMEDAKAEYDAAAEAVRPKLLRFFFRSVDDATFDRLKSEHRPTESQRTDARKKSDPPPEWNSQSFPSVYIATACFKIEGPSGAQDGFSVEDAQRLWADPRWNEAERSALFTTALSARITHTRLVDLPKGG